MSADFVLLNMCGGDTMLGVAGYVVMVAGFTTSQ